MTIRPLSLLASLALAVVCAAPGTARAAETQPLARTKGLIEAFKAVPDGSAEKGGEKAREAAFATLDGFFDLERFVADCIEPSKAKLDAAQLATYSDTFQGLVRAIAYPDSGDFLRKAKLEWGKATVDGEKAAVVLTAREPEEDFEVELTFRWARSGAAWRVVDVDFDGDSLVKDYQNQFGRIVGKEGVVGLLKRLGEKEAELSGDKAAKK